MIHNFLKKLSKIEIDFNKKISYNADWTEIINTAIFKKDFFIDYDWNIDKYKISFFLKLSEKEIKILKLKLEVEVLSEKWQISDNWKEILYSEINAKLKKISFLREVFDIEAHKVSSEYKYKKKKIDYIHYNRIFFWVSKITLNKKYLNNSCAVYKDTIPKDILLKAVGYSKKINPELDFNFGNFPNLSHKNWVINVSQKDFYNMQNVISIFFHETTHFFWYKNWVSNFGFNYSFVDYTTLEEWISLYNEYLYWNQITHYWKFSSFYDECYEVLLMDISEEVKKEKIYQILKCKWYSKKKALWYYYRFHRFWEIWSSNLFFKDLMYTKAYINVDKLLKKSTDNYEVIMSWKIGLNEIKKWLYKNNHNKDSKKYFEKMTSYIIKYVKDYE